MSASAIRVLLYHDIVRSAQHFQDSGFPGADADSYKIDEAEFRRHLDSVEEVARKAPSNGTFGRLLDAGSASGSQVVFSFDDTGQSNTLIADLLEEKGWRGHFFAPTQFIGKPGFMDARGLRDLARRGHSVGSHSVTHPLRMAELSPDRIYVEWKDSLDCLSQILGQDVTVASVPGGMYSGRVRAAAVRAGVKLLFTSEPRSRLQTGNDMTVCGRYAVFRRSSLPDIVRIASGDATYLAASRVIWDSKKVAKRILGPAYLAIRKVWFATRANAKN